MDAGKNAHRYVAWIVADKHLVDFQNRTEFSIQDLRRDVREVEINLVLTADSVTVKANLKDLARGNVPGYKIAVSRILFLKKIETLFFRNLRRRSRVAFLARHPDAPPFAARRLGH